VFRLHGDGVIHHFIIFCDHLRYCVATSRTEEARLAINGVIENNLSAK
jgi:hypothetical protein